MEGNMWSACEQHIDRLTTENAELKDHLEAALLTTTSLGEDVAALRRLARAYRKRCAALVKKGYIHG